MVIGVLGGGRWGFALGCAARAAGNEVLVCTRREPETGHQGLELTTELAELGRRTRLILLAVPSNVARTVAGALGDVVDGSHMVVHGVRGLSDEGLLPLSEIVRQETAVRRVGAIAGPVLADELLEGKPSVIATASRYPEVLEAMHQALGSATLRVSATRDLLGLEWASALVGALMVGLGYAREAGLGAGLLAGLMTRGLHEATALGVAAGADEHTFWGVAGYGDLLAAMGQDRPEVRFGHALATGLNATQALAQTGMRVEAIDLVPRLVAFAHDRDVPVPVFIALADVLAGRGTKEMIMPGLMRSVRAGR